MYVESKLTMMRYTTLNLNINILATELNTLKDRGFEFVSFVPVTLAMGHTVIGVFKFDHEKDDYAYC